jgi:tetratricopeptide (TPR) repeat protein
MPGERRWASLRGGVIGMDKDELLERYEALGEEADFLAARPLFERDIRDRDRRGQPDPLLLRQYGYLLECHGRYTIRRAIARSYERAMAADPDADKVRYQWIAAKASLGEQEHAIALYRRRAAAAPGSVRELRFLAAAYLAAHDYAAAADVIGTGLALAPRDWALIADRGEVRAGTGDTDGALADWRGALELDPEELSPVYSSAFLLEREGRLAEAAEAWRHIVEFSTARGWELTAAWPRQELQRLRGLLAGNGDPGE